MNRPDWIRIDERLSLPASELEWRFVRAPGPGGQNVNKLATAAELRWDVERSPSLTEEVRQRLRKLAGTRLNSEGVLVIQASRHRTQERNRKDALERLILLVGRALVIPKARKPTRPSRNARLRRLESKRRHSSKKSQRRVSRDQ